MIDIDSLCLRAPYPEDGPHVTRLIAASPPLDTNSSYCNLLQCCHFSDTSVAAFADGVMVGFISGYRSPSHPQTLFIWQVAVAEQARGCGLGIAMLEHIVAREINWDITYMDTTITENNAASWALFSKFAARQGANLERTVMFDCERHFAGAHDTEFLAHIGPFARADHSY